MSRADMPFTLLALAPVHTASEQGRSADPVTTDLSGLDEAMQVLGPSLQAAVPKHLCPRGDVSLRITSIKDFKPDMLVKNTPYLSRLQEAGQWIRDAHRQGVSLDDMATKLRSQWPELPLDVSRAQASKSKAPTTRKLDQILGMVDMPSGSDQSTAQPPTDGDLLSQADGLLGALLEKVFENQELRAYEAVWRGIQSLLRQGGVKQSQGMLLKIVPVTKDSLESVLERLADELASEPPGLALLDLPFDSTPRSIELLEKLTWFAETLMVPSVAWVEAGFFHLEDWSQLNQLSLLKHHLEGSAFAKWRKLREHPGAGWVSLVCNRFLGRLPYGPENRPKGVRFHEANPLWLSPVWALGALVAQSMERFGWPNRFSDYHNIRLSGLPLTLMGHQGAWATEMLISEERLHQLVEVGITPLVGPRGKDVAFVPKEATLSGGSLQVQLFVSRVLGFFFWLQHNLDETERKGDLDADLKQAFSLLWQKTGHQSPEDLEVLAGDPDEQGFIPLTVQLTPPHSVLAGGQKLAFGFRWGKTDTKA